MSTGVSPRPSRRHDLDALRVLVFGLLILYHLAMAYVADWGWHVKSAYQADWLQAPMMLVNRWRMPLLFLISGLAIGLYEPSRARWRFVKDRSVRLLVPLGFAMATTIPLQAYWQGVFNGKVEPGLVAFLMDYFSFRPWPEGAFDGSDIGITWNHLWYLPYLWLYTVLLALLLPALESGIGRRIMGWVAGLRWPALLLMLAAWIWLAMLLLADHWPQANNLFADWYQHMVFFAVFLLGYAMARGAYDADALAKARKPLLATTIAIGAVYLPLALSMPAVVDGGMPVVLRALRALYTAAALFTVLAWGRHLLERPFGWLPQATEAVFPWYILHQTLIVGLVFALSPLRLGPVLEPALVLLGTFGGCWLLYDRVISRIGFLRPLFGLKRQRGLSTLADGRAILNLPAQTHKTVSGGNLQ